MSYKQNLEIIRDFNHELVPRIEQADDRAIEAIPVNGTTIYKLIDDSGHEFYSASIVNPQFEAEALLESVNLDNKGYVVLGIPSVAFFEQLLTATTTAAWLIIMEKDIRLVKRFLRDIKLKKYLKGGICRILFVNGDLQAAQHRLRIILESYEGLNFFKPELIRTFPTYRRDETYYNVMNVKTFEIVRYKCQMSGNQLHSTLKGIRQEIENLPELVKLPRLVELKNKYKNKPMICVASGPSLDKQLPMLKQLQGKVIILCAVSAFRVLVNNGIEPDIVSVLERGPHAMDVCFNDTPIPKKTWLFVLSVVDPRLFKFWPNPVIPCFKERNYCHQFTNDALGNMGTLITAHSVAHMNLMLAEYLGASTIIMLGQDLAYADSGRTHSVHTHYEKESQNQATADKSDKVSYLNEEVFVDGYYGGKVRSKRIWQNFLVSMERLVDIVNSKVINATEGGAKIRGTIQEPFNEWFEKLQQESYEPLDTYKAHLYADIKPSAERIHDAYGHFKRLMNDIESVIEKSENWLKAVDALDDDALMAQAHTHSLKFGALFNYFFKFEYLVNYFRPVMTMLHISTNPISRMTDLERVKALFLHYNNFATILARGGRILVQTIEEQFQLILPPLESELDNQEISEMIAESLQSCRDYVPVLIDACDRFRVYFEEGNPDWIVLLGDFTSGINWFQEVIAALQSHGVEQTKNIALPEVIAILKECEQHLTTSDLESFLTSILLKMKPLLESFAQELNLETVNK